MRARSFLCAYLYAFNAAMGRRLSPEDFGTFAALLAVLLALSGPTTALFGGAAMSAARSGLISRPPWRFGIGLGGLAAVVMGLAPLPIAIRLLAWLAFGCAMWLLVSWNPEPDAKQYEVETSSTNGFGSRIESHRVDGTSWTPDIDLRQKQNRGTLYWRVAPIDWGGNVGSFATGVFASPRAPKHGRRTHGRRTHGRRQRRR